MKYDLIFGCDPGLSGGVSLLNEKGELQLVEPMPVIVTEGKGKTKKGNKKKETKLDIERLKEMFNQNRALRVLVVLEKQQAMKKGGQTQGVSSTFKTGMNYGILIGLLEGLNVEYVIIPSVTWKNAVIGKNREKGSTEANKRASLKKAQELFPREDFLATSRSYVPHDGMYESALIGYHGYLLHNVEKELKFAKYADKNVNWLSGD